MGAHIEMSLLLLLLLPTMPTHKGDCFDMNTFGEFRTPSSSPPIVVSDGAIRIIPAARADRLNVCTPHLFQVDRLRYVFYFILFYFCARREEWRTGKGRDPRQTGDEILFSYSYSSGATSQLGYVQTPRAATCYVIFLRPATNKLTVATQMHPSRGCKKREKEKVALFIFPSSLLKEKRSREMDTLVSLALTRCPRPLLYTSTSIPSDEALVLLLLLFIVHLLMPL